MSDVVAGQIARHRRRLDLTRDQLADECAKLGAPKLTAAVITNIETGRRDAAGRRRRDVTVDELLIFAHALAVPPLLLLFPLGVADAVPALPNGDAVHPHFMWRWALGEVAPARVGPDGALAEDVSRIGGEDGPTRFEAWRSAVYPADLYRKLWEAQASLRAAEDEVRRQTSRGPDSEATQLVVKARTASLVKLGDVINEMTKVGIRVPDYPAEWIRELRELGVLKGGRQ